MKTTKPATDAIPAFVRVREYGGTYIAGAKIGIGKMHNSSCTHSAELAAKRAASFVLCCSEDDIELKPATEGSNTLFWASLKA